MFSNKYLKFAGSASSYNPISALIYMTVFPIAKISQKLGLTPNFVTFCSFVFTLLAFYALSKNHLFYYTVFWLTGYLLDFVDGTLARMTNNIRKTALRIDHLSDLIKIAILLLGFGIYFNDTSMWIFLFVTTSLFFFYAVVNHDLGAVIKISSLKFSNESKRENSREIKAKVKVEKRTIFQDIWYSKNIFFLIDGHTLLIFFLIPIGKTWAYSSLSYFCIILLYQSMLRIKSLSNYPKV
jgi:phosphatidylglycerophosphate synthase